MSTEESPATPPDSTPPPTPPAQEPPVATPPADDGNKETFRQERDRVRKQNEKLQAELDELRKTQMSDQEKAIEEAKAAGRAEAINETAKTLAGAQLRTAAAEAGVKLGDIVDLIDVSRFVGDDGAVDTDAITAAVAKFKTVAPAVAQPTPGPQGGSSAPTQLTRADLKNMTPDQITEAKAAGRLNDLLGIK